MSKEFTFECPLESFQSLQRAIDLTRSNTPTVKVNKEVLSKLIIDHTRLLARLKVEG